MNTPRHIALGLMLLALGSLGATLFSSSAPTMRTNAPGEQNCTGCHSGTLNNGPGNISLSGISNYTPGMTYTLSFSLSDNTKSRYGFSMTVLNGSNQPIGTLVRTNTTNTNLQTGTVSGATRQYIGHRLANSNSTWSFNWTAPTTNVGPITFYGAGNATNNNGGTSGDNVYTQTFVINPAPPPLKAGFTVSNSNPCQSQMITFTDTSAGSNPTYSWNFGAGATPATANTAGPHMVSYASPGPKAIQLIVTDTSGMDTADMGINVNALPSVSFTSLDSSYCENGGEVVLSASPAGGTFSGSGVNDTLFSPAFAGTGQQILTYSYTDLNGCTASANDTTAVLSAPNVMVSPSGPYSLCVGDSLSLDAGAGYASYAWSDGSTGQRTFIKTGGIYDVIVSNQSGCRDTSELLVVNDIPLPVVNISITGDSTFCDGDSSILDAGAGFSSYQWSNGSSSQVITVRSSGSFNVVVSDSNGCADSAAMATGIDVLPSPAKPGVSPLADSLELCEGDTLYLQADSGFSSYQWSTGDLGRDLLVTTPGAFFVIVSDTNLCTNRSDAKNVIVNSLPNPFILVHNGDTLTVDPFVSYQWSFIDTLSGMSTDIAGATSQQFPAGDYANDTSNTGVVVVTVIDANGCTNTSDPFSIPAATAIDPGTFPGTLSVYPNPASDLLWIGLDLEQSRQTSIRLYDMQGKVLYQQAHKQAAGRQDISLSLADFASGIYLLEVTAGGSKTYQKVVKR